ncbi:MAG: hypothetical protein JNL83_35970 [Myxococcales bacterium]|nr:hypothetical protein [Myxococcales bacterium]
MQPTPDGPVQPYPPSAPPALFPYPLAIQLKMSRFYGHLFLAANRLYFVCDKAGSAWGQAIGMGLGGAIGGAIAGLATPGPGQSPGMVDEMTVYNAASSREGSLIMEARDISMIKHTIFWRLIKWQGKTIGLPQGMDKELRVAIGHWARHHNVKTKGGFGP